jgi:hypothetical protein
MKLYVYSVMAMKSLPDEEPVVYHQPGLCTATSMEEAADIVYQTCHSRFPIDQGFTNQDAVISNINIPGSEALKLSLLLK